MCCVNVQKMFKISEGLKKTISGRIPVVTFDMSCDVIDKTQIIYLPKKLSLAFSSGRRCY